MDSLIYSFNVVIPVFLVVLIGYILRRINVINDNFVEIGTKLTFKLALPFSIFKSIYTADIAETFDINLVVYCVSCIFLLFLILCISLPFFIKNKSVCATVVQGIFRSNFLILGVPLAMNMFGAEGLAPTTLLLSFAIPMFNLLAIVGFAVIVGDNDPNQNKVARWTRTILNILKNPLFIASILGVIFSLLHFKLPVIIEKTVFDIGSMATPLALLTLGGQFDIKKVKSSIGMIIFSTIGRIVIAPSVIVVTAVLLGFRNYELGAIFVLFSAPTAVSSYVMAKNMGGDGDLAGQIVLFTTFFSMFTITIGLYILKFLALL